MKILSLVSYNIFPARLGGQKGIALFNEYLAREAGLVCVTVKSNDPSFAKGYKVYPVLSNSPLRYINPFYFFSISTLIKREKISHLVLEHPYYGWLGILLKWFTGIKLVVHSHNIENTRWKSLGKWWWRILFWYEGKVHRSADYNFFIQEDDRQYGIRYFKLKEEKTTVITYGIEWNTAPGSSEKQRCKQLLQQQYGFDQETKVFLFNGTLSYPPNLQAVITILEKINPLLLSSALNYKIIICGNGLPEIYNELKNYRDKNILYAGFVDDITLYFKGADLFLNPVVEGGGIKTKLVEAIGYGTPAVSTQNGSIGVNRADAGDLLHIVDDGNWESFAQETIRVCQLPASAVPESFFQKFYWSNIARKAVSFIHQ